MAFGWFKKGGDGSLERARKLAARGRWAEALSYYEEALDASPESEEARTGLRTCRERLVEGNLEEARTFERAGEPDRAREHAQLALELAADAADLVERARDALDALEAPPEEPRAPERLFEPSCGCAAPCTPEETAPAPGEEGDPEHLYEFYLEGLPPAERAALEEMGAEFRRGYVLLQQGETGAARPHLEAAEEGSPRAASAYALGLLASLEGDPEGAEAHFARALERAPEFGPAVHHRSELLWEADRREEALAALEEWTGAHPDDGEGWLLAARLRLRGGDAGGALAAAREAEPHVPEGDPRPSLLRGQAHRARGEDDEALRAFQAVAARRPDLLEALIPLGQILLEKGGASAERAAEVFKHTYRLDPERGWWHLTQVARAYASRGWTDQAREILQGAKRELPEAPEARDEWEAARREVGA